MQQSLLPSSQQTQASTSSSSLQQSMFSPSPRLGFNRQTNQQVKLPQWMTERCDMFRCRTKKSKKLKLSMWEHEFICSTSISQSSSPSPIEKAELICAGFGPKKLSFFQYGVSAEFHDGIASAFPKFTSGGGYELMQTMPNNNKELCVIPPPSG